MPTYNDQEYIGFSIESFLQQKYTNWELIIVDDASTDDTMIVVRGYNDFRIKHFRQEKNGDQLNSLIKASENATGKINKFKYD